MFFHQYKYRIKYFMKTPTVLFWALIFPMLLGTLFQSTFGSSDNVADLETIPVAVITEVESDANTQFLAMMETITYDNDKLMFQITQTSKEDAIDQLHDGDISGIITLGDQRELTVSKSGMFQSIIQQFLNQYLRSESYIEDIMTNHPESIMDAVANLSKDMNLVEATSVAGSKMSFSTQYFYALIAMVCLFGSYLGMTNAKDVQANLSPIAARRCVSASRKITLVLADSLAALTIHFLEIVVVYFYLLLIGVDLGNQPFFFFLTCFFGSMIGILLGQFVGVAVKGSENMKEGICTSVSLFLSFLSGLMFANMKDIVAKNAPIIDKINPAALITNCFYCLSVYDDYNRYFESLISLIVISIILLIGTILLERRERYESI